MKFTELLSTQEFRLFSLCGFIDFSSFLVYLRIAAFQWKLTHYQGVKYYIVKVKLIKLCEVIKISTLRINSIFF